MLFELLIMPIVIGVVLLIMRNKSFYCPTKKERKLMRTAIGRRALAKLERKGESINFGPK